MHEVIKIGISLFTLFLFACRGSQLYQRVEIAEKTYLVPYESGSVDSNKEFRVAPAYPEQAYTNCVEGSVTLEFTLRSDGYLENIIVVDTKPKGIFETVALEALSKWRLNPGRYYIKGFPKCIRQVLNFKMREETPSCLKKSVE